MHIALSAHDPQSLVTVVTVSGTVDAVDVPPLQDQVMELLDLNQGDVLIDLHWVTAVDDALAAGLAAMRSRSRFVGRRVVVVDDADGATLALLRRHGMHFRIPVYLEVDAATTGLRADREARDRPAPSTAADPVIGTIVTTTIHGVADPAAH